MKFKNILFFSALSFAMNAFGSYGGGDDTGNGGNNYLDKTSVNQYMCLAFLSRTTTDGSEENLNVAKVYKYYLDELMPLPSTNRSFVCHDIFRYGNTDMPEFPRLNLKQNYFPLFSRFDSRLSSENGMKRAIDKMIEEDILKEMNISYSSNLFNEFNIDQGYGFVLRPILNARTNKVYCPGANGSLFDKIITAYTGDTEGLYIGNLEEQDLGSPYPPVRTSLFATESLLMKNGFYIRDGVKSRISDVDTLDKKTIYFYYPFSDTIDPLIKGERKIVTITFPQTNTVTKRIGCIAKGGE